MAKSKKIPIKATDKLYSAVVAYAHDTNLVGVTVAHLRIAYDEISRLQSQNDALRKQLELKTGGFICKKCGGEVWPVLSCVIGDSEQAGIYHPACAPALLTPATKGKNDEQSGNR